MLKDEVFYKRQLEVAKRLSAVVKSEVKGIIVTEYLYPWQTEYERMLSYSEIKQTTKKIRVNVTLVYEGIIPAEVIPMLNKIMCCHYVIDGNQLWYSMKPERLDFYMRTKET